MQDPQPPTSSVALNYTLYVLAIILSGTGIGTIVKTLMDWRKPKAEVESIHATSEKTRAEGRSLDSSTIDRAYERIDDLYKLIDSLNKELQTERARTIHYEDLVYQVKTLQFQLDEKKTEILIYETQQKRMKGIMDAHGWTEPVVG